MWCVMDGVWCALVGVCVVCMHAMQCVCMVYACYGCMVCICLVCVWCVCVVCVCMVHAWCLCMYGVWCMGMSMCAMNVWCVAVGVCVVYMHGLDLWQARPPGPLIVSHARANPAPNHCLASASRLQALKWVGQWKR